MTTDEAVLAASTILGEAETIARNLKIKLRELKEPLAEVSSETNLGASILETKSMTLAAELIGLQAEADVWAIHRQMTEIAKARGVDLVGILGGTR